MPDNYPIPVLFIQDKFLLHKVYHKNQILDLIDDDHEIQEELLDADTVVQILEMARVNALNNNISQLTEFIETWRILGYNELDDYLILYSESSERFNAKASMFLNKPISGLVAVIPQELYLRLE